MAVARRRIDIHEGKAAVKAWLEGANSTLNVDASVQYTWNQHLKFTLEGINLTDQFQDQFNDSSNRLSFYHHTGREILVGVRYTY